MDKQGRLCYASALDGSKAVMREIRRNLNGRGQAEGRRGFGRTAALGNGMTTRGNH